MIKRPINHDNLMDNVRFRYILTRHDPVVPQTQADLAILEADILRQLDAPSQRGALTTMSVHVGVLQHGWTVRVAAFVSILIMSLGFIVGQISYRGASDPLLAGEPSLLAFADENLWQSISATDTSAGENDDDTE